MRNTIPMEYAIFIVEDHPVTREGLSVLMERQPDFHVVGAAASFEQAVAQIPAARPDLVVVDLALGGPSGIDLIEQVRAQEPDIRMLAVSGHDEMLYAERALRAGAMGYVMKRAPVEDLIAAVRAALRGEVYVSEAVRESLIARQVPGGAAQAVAPHDRLSDREAEVFSHLAQGRSTSQIAEAMDISPRTVGTYRERIKQKLDLSNSTELIRHAVEWQRMQRDEG